MSGRRGRQHLYLVTVAWSPDYSRLLIRANSEEEAIEKIIEERGQEMLHEWMKYSAELREDEE